MSLTRHIMRILGAVTILAALSLVPSVAEAHSGHAHATAPTAGKSAPAETAKQEQAVTKSEAADSQQMVSTAEIKGGANAQPSGDRGCNGACCAAACTACCVSLSAQSAGQDSPYAEATRLALPDDSIAASLTPDRLSRPPKSFA